jgi:CRP-like cAMP-binding protein
MPLEDVALELFPQLDGVELIQKVDLFHALGYEETMALAAICRVERFPSGAALIEQNALTEALYIIRAGAVRVTRIDSRGQEDLLARLGAGDLVGEMSLVEADLASANVVADGEVEAVVVPRKELERLLADNERLALKVFKSFCRGLSDRLRRTTIAFSESQ